MEFKFDLNVRRNKYSDEQILGDLKKFAATVGHRPFTSVEYQAWPEHRHSVCLVTTRFNSWPAALERIGIKGARPRTYSAEHAINALEHLWRKLGYPPGRKALHRSGGLSGAPYDRIWGGVRQACTYLARYHAKEISRDELLAGAPPSHRRPRKQRKSLNPELRWSILLRDHQRCTVCGQKAGPDVVLEVDHITPVSKGGDDSPTNLRTLCFTCNRGKGAKLEALQ